jgi:hypothetical protein
MNRVIAIVAAVAAVWMLLPLVLNLVGLGMMSSLVGHARLDLSSLPQLLVTIGMPIVLLKFARDRFNASSTKLAEYAKRPEGDATLFDVKPAAAPVHWFAAILAVVLYSAWPATHWIMGAIMIGLAALILLRDPRNGSEVRPRSFRVSRSGIELDGHTVSNADVHRLGITNQFGGDVEIVYDARTGIPTGTLAGLAHRQKVGAVAYRVQVEAAGKAHVLAAGLDEVTARGIVADVGKALGLGVAAG